MNTAAVKVLHRPHVANITLQKVEEFEFGNFGVELLRVAATGVLQERHPFFARTLGTCH